MRADPRPRHSRFLLALGVVGLVAAACGDDGSSDQGAPVDTTTSTSVAVQAVDYSQRGPYGVGQVDLQIDDEHQIAVFYPTAADAGDDPEAEAYSYSGGDVLPAEFADFLPGPLAEPQAMPDTWVGAPASDDGPFPVLLHSHGFSGQFRFAGFHNSHVASWGYVVASVDHPERGLLGVLGLFEGDGSPDLDTGQLFEALELLEAESATAGSALEDTVDSDRVAAEGHSAGGSASGAAVYDPRIDAWLGQAPGAPVDPSVDRGAYTGTDDEGDPTFDGDAYRAENPPPDVPSMIIAADGDVAITLDEIEPVFEWLAAPKRLAVLENAGHNAFTDPCKPIQEAGGISRFVEAIGIDPDTVPFVRLGEDGCSDENGPAEVGWTVIDHLTVAQLNWVFGIDAAAAAASLERSYLDDTFPGLLEDYEVVD